MKVLNTNIQVKKVSIENHNLKGNFKMLPIYTKQIIKEDDLNYTLILGFSVLNSKENPFPIDMTVHLASTFTFSNESSEEQIENFMQIAAIQIIYPHLRSLVSSITASSYLQPLLLPLINANLFQNV
ncbi:protein-export chaperone SecB [Acholeplasma granularum]|uniref:protein-export chaperone SecB n=1 Tax=Acholeplasma granularum TaxID=264635 RepID=UPI000472F667|nr:protein-export chaperone SecB [Acholeplasma granularum]